MTEIHPGWWILVALALFALVMLLVMMREHKRWERRVDQIMAQDHQERVVQGELTPDERAQMLLEEAVARSRSARGTMSGASPKAQPEADSSSSSAKTSD